MSQNEMNSIVFTTRRLRLEKIRTHHKVELFKLLSNPKVHKYFPKPLDEKESEEFFNQVQDRYQEDGYCFWAVMLKANNAFLGVCGLLSQTIEGVKEVEVGYRLSDKFWNQGYGTEAANGCIAFAKDNLKISSLISLIRPVNKASIRVAEKNGFKPEKEVVFHELPHLVYRLYLT